MNKGRGVALVVACSIIFFGLWSATQLTFNFDLSTFTSEDSQESINYKSYSNKFPFYSQGITIIIDFEKKLEKLEDFRKIERLTNQLIDLKGVKNTTSITSIRLPERNGFGMKKRSLVHLSNEATFHKYFAKLNAYSDVTPKFISKENNATCIYVDLDIISPSITIERIQECVAKFNFPKTYYSGSEFFKKTAEETYSSEMFKLVSIGGTGLIALFFFFFRDLRSLVIVLFVIGQNIAGILIAFWLFEITIGILTLTIPLLILVLSFCDIVHVLYRFKLESKEFSVDQRLINTMNSLRSALWLTSLTTFCAFAIFTFSSVDQIVDFGLITCIGIAIAYLSARYLLPQFIVFFRVQPFNKEPKVSFLVTGIKMALVRFRMIATIGVIGLIFLAISVILNFSINDSPQNNLGDEMGSSIAFLNENFDGARTIEVVITDTNVLTENNIHLVDSIEHYLRTSYQCNAVFSVNTVVKRLNRYNHFGIPQYFKIPNQLDGKFFAQLEEKKEALGLLNAVTEDHKLLRIVGRLKDEGSADARIRNLDLNAFLRTLSIDEDRLFISGHSFVYDQSTFRVTWLILISVILSVVMAMIVIGIVFRSMKVVLALLIPNLIPLVGALWLMHALGIDLNPFSAMALSILLGLSIDDTIYITSCVRDNISSGSPYPIEKSLKKNVFPILVTSLLLTAGFGTLIFSSIESNKNIGILVSIILLIALLSDLLILPALLKWITRSNRDD